MKNDTKSIEYWRDLLKKSYNDPRGTTWFSDTTLTLTANLLFAISRHLLENKSTALTNEQMAYLIDLEPHELDEPLVIEILMDYSWSRWHGDQCWRYSGTLVPALDLGKAAAMIVKYYVMDKPYPGRDE